jgi:uncharacterized membrane protein
MDSTMMTIAWVALLALLGVVAWGILSMSNTSPKEAEREAEEQLKQQRARGEIDDAEFKRRMVALHH